MSALPRFGSYPIETIAYLCLEEAQEENKDIHDLIKKAIEILSCRGCPSLYYFESLESLIKIGNIAQKALRILRRENWGAKGCFGFRLLDLENFAKPCFDSISNTLFQFSEEKKDEEFLVTASKLDPSFFLSSQIIIVSSQVFNRYVSSGIAQQDTYSNFLSRYLFCLSSNPTKFNVFLNGAPGAHEGLKKIHDREQCRKIMKETLGFFNITEKYLSSRVLNILSDLPPLTERLEQPRPRRPNSLFTNPEKFLKKLEEDLDAKI